LKENESESTEIERSPHFEDYINEKLRSLDAKIPKNSDKIPIKEFDWVLKEVLEQINK
jgi:hypothetical protein